MASHNLELVTLGRDLLVCVANLDERLLPGCGLELFVNTDEWVDQALCAESIAGETGLVVDPFLVDVVVETGENSHNLNTTGIDADV